MAKNRKAGKASLEAAVKLGMGRTVLSEQSLKALHDRLQAQGGLKVEFGVPRLYDGASPKERLDRYRHIDETKVCATITKLWTDDAGDVHGNIVPSGPMSSFVEKALKQGKAEDLTFAVRGMAGPGVELEVVTYDLVGIEGFR